MDVSFELANQLNGCSGLFVMINNPGVIGCAWSLCNAKNEGGVNNQQLAQIAVSLFWIPTGPFIAAARILLRNGNTF
ncbi:hypothetical protein [Pelagibius litoralis]|uniref:hypothetical protein n=1 Tax=Pelagibius litoralis TaxID=374515 RepID=UPI00142035AD|nr:hypothetical protein [Pelagibius litoralis]